MREQNRMQWQELVPGCATPMVAPLVIPLFIPHHGCRHDCLFCNQKQISGAQSIPRKAEITAEIENWLSRTGSGRIAAGVQVAYYGGSFTCLPLERQRELLAPVQRFLDSGRVDGVRLSTRPDCIDRERMDLLKAHGVKLIELGVQSFDDRVLERNRRGHSTASVLRAFNLLQEEEFSVGIQLMPGLLGATRRSFLRDIDTVIRLRPQLVRLYPALVVKGTGLARRYLAGTFRPWSLAEAVAICAEAVQRLDRAGIPVARLGLQPSATLEAGVLAGPYHPAFGERVRTRLFHLRIRRRLAGCQPGQALSITVSHRDISAVVGERGGSRKLLEERGRKRAVRLKIQASRTQPRGTISYAVSQPS